jgi:hypothetical protein
MSDKREYGVEWWDGKKWEGEQAGARDRRIARKCNLCSLDFVPGPQPPFGHNSSLPKAAQPVNHRSSPPFVYYIFIVLSFFNTLSCQQYRSTLNVVFSICARRTTQRPRTMSQKRNKSPPGSHPDPQLLRISRSAGMQSSCPVHSASGSA